MQFRRRRCSRFSNTLRTLKRAAVRWEVKNLEGIAGKAKVTQTMTRDGLVVENQADGTVENVSSREAEQDYSTDAEGKAEKFWNGPRTSRTVIKIKRKAKKDRRNRSHRRKRRWPAPFRCPFGIDRGRTGRPGVAAVHPKSGSESRQAGCGPRCSAQKACPGQGKSLRCCQRQGKIHPAL